jgi:phage tail protein X
MRYRTSDGDMLDLICWRHYGGRPGAVETVLEANPGLADYGEVLPAGVFIELPELTGETKQASVKLWE